MSVREHASQHAAIAELPLVTRSATVREVTRMDRNRRDEAIEAVERLLDRRAPKSGGARAVDPESWPTLVSTLRTAGRGGLARRVAALHERVSRPHPMLVRARFEVDAEFDYVAGQYVGLRYDGNSRAYSIASALSEERLEICVRRVPGGRLSPKLCGQLKPTDTVTIRGPHGELVLQEPSARDIVFLATGAGVAPFKGMIDHLFATGQDSYEAHQRDVWLFLGAAWADDLPYAEHFRALQRERENFHFVPCLSREPYLGSWDGETDYVQHALLKHVDATGTAAPLSAPIEQRLRQTPRTGRGARLKPQEMDVYACGINAMVHSLVSTVRRLGVPPRRIESEGFG
ncbi:MAG: ferredoxin--NADP reductase [Halodesulfurarchaeum sp.]